MDNVQVIQVYDRVCLDATIEKRTLPNPLYMGDVMAHRIKFRVYQNRTDTTPLDLSEATIMGYFIRPNDNATVVITGVGGAEYSYIDLPQSCYIYDGTFELTVKAVNTSANVATLLRVEGWVETSTTDTLVDPSEIIPSLEELLEQVDACEDATDAANAAAADATAAASSAVRYDTEQTLTDAQAETARDNIGAANVEDVIISMVPEWEQGGLALRTGGVPTTTSADRIRLTGTLDADTIYTIQATTDYVFAVFGWDSSSTYLGWYNPAASAWTKITSLTSSVGYAFIKGSTLTNAGASKIRVVALAADGSNILPSVGSNISFTVFVKTLGSMRDSLEDLDTIKESLEVGIQTGEYVKGYNIYTNVAVGETVSMTPNTSESMSYCVVPCTEGDRFLITGEGFNNPRAWAFTDESYVLLEKAASSTDGQMLTRLLKVAPADGYLIVNTSNEVSHSVLKKTLSETVAEDVEALKTAAKKKSNEHTMLVAAQKSIAEDWHFGFINVADGMGLGSAHIIPGTKDLYSGSYASTYDRDQRHVWMQDGIHPFMGDGLTEMYAHMISAQIAMIPPNYADGVGSTSPTVWSGRKLVWLGTSIPANSDPDAGDGSGASYPSLVASSLGATLLANLSRGSSCMRINASTGTYTGMRFTHFLRALTRTQEEATYIAENWADIKDHLTGTVPDTLSDSQIDVMRNCSFENLLLPYLNGQNDMPDLFVIDHGHNDIRPVGIDGESDLWVTPSVDAIESGLLAEDTWMTEEIGDVQYKHLVDVLGSLDNIEDKAAFAASLNRNCFKGAVNFLVTVILKYNPFARVVIIGDYD